MAFDQPLFALGKFVQLKLPDCIKAHVDVVINATLAALYVLKYIAYGDYKLHNGKTIRV